MKTTKKMTEKILAMVRDMECVEVEVWAFGSIDITVNIDDLIAYDEISKLNDLLEYLKTNCKEYKDLGCKQYCFSDFIVFVYGIK